MFVLLDDILDLALKVASVRSWLMEMGLGSILCVVVILLVECVLEIVGLSMLGVLRRGIGREIV